MCTGIRMICFRWLLRQIWRFGNVQKNKYTNIKTESDNLRRPGRTGFSNDIQVIDFGGNSELARKLNILKNMENFDRLTSLLIIRDAETNAESACLSYPARLLQIH